MQKSIYSLLILLAASSFFMNKVFAGDPIPGISVGAGKNPGGQLMSNSKTGNVGKCTLQPIEKGNYSLNISYEEIVKKVNELTKGKTSNKNGYLYKLQIEETFQNLIVKGKPIRMPRSGGITIAIAKDTNISFDVAAGTAIKGILTNQKNDPMK